MRHLQLRRLVILIGLALIGQQAAAAAIVWTEELRIAQIIGLDINGTLYDVSFDGSFGSELFIGNQQAAYDTGLATRNSFPTFTTYAPYGGFFPEVANPSSYAFRVYYTPTDYYQAGLAAGWTYSSFDEPSHSDNLEDHGFYSALYEVHTTRVVSGAQVPPAVWLFGSALGLMGVMRRKVS